MIGIGMLADAATTATTWPDTLLGLAGLVFAAFVLWLMLR